MGASSSRGEQLEQEPSLLQTARDGYQELVKAIIRPPRTIYDLAHLGPPMFSFFNKTFRRTDFIITNLRGQKLHCSHWEPDQRPNEKIPCVVYLHGNSSARIEALSILSCCFSVGTSVFSFDFSGSGISDGEYVSLGFYEKDDLQCVVEHLRNSGNVSTIALWGRSMGAATALMHGHRDPSIGAMILDSAFSDLTSLAEELAAKGRQQGINIPSVFVFAGIHLIRSTIQKRAGFDIRQIQPIQYVESCFIPALFVAANEDTFIDPHHSRDIYANYAGDKNLIMIGGNHNSQRPQFLYDSTFLFLRNYLQIDASDGLDTRGAQIGSTPPWVINRNFNVQLGMTEERQEQIQRSLFQMFGHQQTRQASNANETLTNKNTLLQSPISLQQIPSETSMNEWSCPMCTLINPVTNKKCSLCGQLYLANREQDEHIYEPIDGTGKAHKSHSHSEKKKKKKHEHQKYV